MKLVIITTPKDGKFETDTINRLFAEGLDELHIRKPKADKDSLKKYISRIHHQYHEKLVLHSHYSLVHTFDIERIHLPYTWKINTLTNFYMDKIVLKGKKITKSITVTDHKAVYKPVTGLGEYILGPVFTRHMYTLNKQLMKSDSLEKAIRHSKIPITALGGVSTDTAEFFKKTGFTSVAMQSSIWQSADPVASFMEIRDHFRATEHKLRIAV